jgi:hypothetical protein
MSPLVLEGPPASLPGVRNPLSLTNPPNLVTLAPVLLQKLGFDAFVENRVSIFQRVTAVKNRTF